MTNTTTDAAEARALTVTQADRDAAARVAEQCKHAFAADGFNERFPQRIREGVWDEHWLVEAFTRHRLATAEAASGAGEREELAAFGASEAAGYQYPGADQAAERAAFCAGAAHAASLPPATDPAISGLSSFPPNWKLRQMHFSAPCADDRKWHVNVYGGREGGDTFVGRGTSADEALRDAARNACTALAAAPTIPATGETWESVAAWCEQTFGPCTPYRMATRAGEELAELVEEAQSLSWSDKARIEAADVLICLSRVPGIWAAVEEKMAINRARKWNVQGDGTGYHIPATGHAATEGEGA